MHEDAVIRELREVKEGNALKHDCDIVKIVAELRRQQDRSGRKVVSRKPKLTATERNE